jgi:hypothetical protein
MQNKKDHLTQRERFFYRAIHITGLICGAGGFYYYLIAGYSEASYLEAAVFLILCGGFSVFGVALHSDIRLIHGCRWLRDEWSKAKKPDSKDRR